MGWQPPSESDFNDLWLTVKVAKEVARTHAKEFGRQWLLDQLKEGLVCAVARTGPTKERGPLEPFVPVLPGLWKTWDDWGPDYFWGSGTAVFEHGGTTGYGDGITARFFDVRFDPKSFDGKVNVAHDLAIVPAPPALAESASIKKPLPAPWLEEWAAVFNKANSDSTEARARASLDATFPHHSVTVRELRRVLPERRQGRPLKHKE
jgi:hypothetical protein